MMYVLMARIQLCLIRADIIMIVPSGSPRVYVFFMSGI